MTNENVTLPLLPLTSGVVLPGMVFTMALESDEARAAVEAARSAGGRLLLVPHIEGRFARVGVIADVMEEGDLPGGLPAVAVRGDQRATIGTGVPGTGEALWVEAEPLDRASSPRRPPMSWPASTGPCSRTSCSAAGAGRIAAAAARGHRAEPLGRHVGVLARPLARPEGRGARDARRRGTVAPRAWVGPATPWPT